MYNSLNYPNNFLTPTLQSKPHSALNIIHNNSSCFFCININMNLCKMFHCTLLLLFFFQIFSHIHSAITLPANVDEGE